MKYKFSTLWNWNSIPAQATANQEASSSAKWLCLSSELSCCWLQFPRLFFTNAEHFWMKDGLHSVPVWQPFLWLSLLLLKSHFWSLQPLGRLVLATDVSISCSYLGDTTICSLQTTIKIKSSFSPSGWHSPALTGLCSSPCEGKHPRREHMTVSHPKDANYLQGVRHCGHLLNGEHKALLLYFLLFQPAKKSHPWRRRHSEPQITGLRSVRWWWWWWRWCMYVFVYVDLV